MRLAALALVSVAACHEARPAVEAPEAVAPEPAAFRGGRGEVSPEEIAAHWTDGTWTVAELVDPRRGLVQFWTETGDVEPVPPDIRTHLCGDALARALPDIEASIAHALRDPDPDEGGVDCTDRECTFSIPGEYEPGRIAIFDHDFGVPTTLVAYLEVDSFTPDADEALTDVRAWVLDQLHERC